MYKAVGALPNTNNFLPLSLAAISTAAIERVIPFSLAKFAVSSSATKHLDLQPKASNFLLFIPLKAMFVSVYIVALFFNASTIFSTAVSDIFNISKYSKSAVVCIERFIIFSSISFLNL